MHFLKKKQLKQVKYGLIQRQSETCGFFSYFITFVGGVQECLDRGLIPVIDMQNYPSMYQKKGENVWDIYYKQPRGICVDEVGDEYTIIDCNNILPEKRPNLSMDFLTNEYAVTYWREICKKYFSLSEFAKNYIKNFESLYLNDEKCKVTLGVLCRGTDYVAVKPYSHPVQPPMKEVILKVQDALRETGCKYIYLATEDQEIYEQFIAHFGECVIAPQVKRFADTGEQYLANIQKETPTDVLEYIASIYMLAKCNSLIAGRTSGSVAAYILSAGYSYTYFWNLGRYGVDDEIFYEKKQENIR